MQKEKKNSRSDFPLHKPSVFGKEAERAVCCYLKKNGYRVLKKNYACRFGEIDVIAKKDKMICFVEVKGRTSVDFGPPAIFVTAQKQTRVKKTALFFITAMALNNVDYRFDVASVFKNDAGLLEIELIEGAFE